MDFQNRHKVVQGYNWLMVGLAVGWIAYIFAGLFFSPSNSQELWVPPPVVQRTLPAEVAPVPMWGPGDLVAGGSNRSTNPRQGSSPGSTLAGSPPTASAPGAPDPTAVWGDAPYVVAPEVAIPPLTPVHPALGPEF